MSTSTSYIKDHFTECSAEDFRQFSFINKNRNTVHLGNGYIMGADSNNNPIYMTIGNINMHEMFYHFMFITKQSNAMNSWLGEAATSLIKREQMAKDIRPILDDDEAIVAFFEQLDLPDSIKEQPKAFLNAYLSFEKRVSPDEILKLTEGFCLKEAN